MPSNVTVLQQNDVRPEFTKRKIQTGSDIKEGASDSITKIDLIFTVGRKGLKASRGVSNKCKE